MGKVGKKLGQALGKAIGSAAGYFLGKYTGMGQGEGGRRGEDIGGGLLGKLIKFKKGGRVKRTQRAIIHKGEFILPRGVKATKKQKARVARGKKRR